MLWWDNLGMTYWSNSPRRRILGLVEEHMSDTTFCEDSIRLKRGDGKD